MGTKRATKGVHIPGLVRNPSVVEVELLSFRLTVGEHPAWLGEEWRDVVVLLS